MTPGTDQAADPLAPLTAALRDRARAAADEVLARAQADAHAMQEQAQQEADALLAQARAKGAADGAAVVAAHRARAEREARRIVLAAQAAAHDELRSAARTAVSALRHDPAYPALLEALRARARRELGPGCDITELEDGGLVAQVPGRRVEFSLTGLADDLVERVVAVREPWSG